jgi:hypothetical protein
MIEAILKLRKLIDSGDGRGPGSAAVIGVGNENVSHLGGGEVHPRTIQASAMGTVRMIGVASGINRGAPKTLRGDANVKGSSLRGQSALGDPSAAAVQSQDRYPFEGR